jgi:hypothetical protein
LLHQLAKADDFFGISGGFPLTDQLRVHAPALLVAQMIDADVRRDAEEPALEARFAAIFADAFEHAHQHILQQIFRVLPERHHAVDVAEERLAPGFDERPKRGPVPFARARDQRAFFFL